MSALATLARIARRQAEEIERELAAAEARLRSLHARIAAHDADVAHEQALARGDIAAALAFGAFAQRALGRRRASAAQQGALAGEVAALRDVLRDAFIELKKIEILIDQETARAAAAQTKRDQAEMDDIATSMTRRRR